MRNSVDGRSLIHLASYSLASHQTNNAKPSQRNVRRYHGAVKANAFLKMIPSQLDLFHMHTDDQLKIIQIIYKNSSERTVQQLQSSSWGSTSFLIHRRSR